MFSYLIRRIALMIPTIFGVCTLVFFLIHLIPGDPVELMLGEQALSVDKTQLRHELGLDKKIHVQYLDYLKGLVRGDLGKSIYSKKKVASEIKERIRPTVELAFVSMIVAILLAIPAGIVSAVKKYSFYDNSSMFLSLLGISMPNFWLGPLLVIVFSIALDWLPVSERKGLSSYILPAVTLGTAYAAIVARMTRSSLLETIKADYIVTARSKGLSERAVILKHALKNALIPVVTIVGLQLGTLLCGAIITEKIFDWPGLGTLVYEAIQTRNYPLVQGCVLLIALTYVVINFLTDLSYSFIDPRIRLTKRIG